MSWDSFIDPVAGFFGQDAENQVQQGNYRTGADEKYKPGVWDHIWGRANDGQAVLDTQNTTQRRKGGRQAFEESAFQSELLGKGIDPEKTSKGAINSAVRAIQEQKAAELRTEGFRQSLAPLQIQMQQGNAQFNATMQRQMANDAKSHQLQLMQFAEAREQKANELEYQKMRDRKTCLLYTSPSPRDRTRSRMPSSA